jgi:hypothetical protein
VSRGAALERRGSIDNRTGRMAKKVAIAEAEQMVRMGSGHEGALLKVSYVKFQLSILLYYMVV